MARRVIKPLKMADGTNVREGLEELRAHFDLASVLGYYSDGRLKEWLEDRYYTEETEKLSQLNPNVTDFHLHLCELLGVDCPEDSAFNMEEITAKKEKLAQLKQFTDSDEVIKNVDSVAFTQEEMQSMLDKNINPIYICGKKFIISTDKKDVVFIGVNNPVVDVANVDINTLIANKVTVKGDIRLNGNHLRKLASEPADDYVETEILTLSSNKKITEQLQCSGNKICEKDGWIYFAPYGGLCKISVNGQEYKDLYPFSSGESPSIIQLVDKYVYYNRFEIIRHHVRLARYSLTGESSYTDYDKNISASEYGFAVHKNNVYANHEGDGLASAEFGENNNYNGMKNLLKISKFNNESPFFIYDTSIYYHMNDAIYKKDLDKGQETMVCKTRVSVFYIDNGSVYFWDNDYRLNIIQPNGDNIQKTDILWSDGLGELSSNNIQSSLINDGYIYYITLVPEYPFKHVIVKIKITESSCKDIFPFPLNIYGSNQIVNNHIYSIYGENGRFKLTKYSLDGTKIWGRYVKRSGGLEID